VTWRPPAEFVAIEQHWRTEIRRLADDRLGYCAPDKCLVEIEETLHPDAVGEVWCHELLHICWNQAGLSGDEELQRRHEQVVRALAPALWSILRRNGLRFDEAGDPQP